MPTLGLDADVHSLRNELSIGVSTSRATRRLNEVVTVDSTWFKRRALAWVYSHDGPIRRRKHSPAAAKSGAGSPQRGTPAARDAARALIKRTVTATPPPSCGPMAPRKCPAMYNT
eukprot:750757-Prorocentrum_minimum.AAC.1